MDKLLLREKGKQARETWKHGRHYIENFYISMAGTWRMEGQKGGGHCVIIICRTQIHGGRFDNRSKQGTTTTYSTVMYRKYFLAKYIEIKDTKATPA